jgi:thymidylate synthase
MYGEQSYLGMCDKILTEGFYRKPEGEEGRFELFAQTLKFDLSNNKLPLFTTKSTWFKGAAMEMLWFISGSTNIKFLKDNGVKIWDIWANEEGEVGPLYGYQWRNWRVDPSMQDHYGMKIDQLQNTINTLRDRPEARSHMVTAWRPDHMEAMSIKPCHILLQFYRVGDELSLAMFQRSCDVFLGVPFNIAQYSLLTHMVAHLIGCKAKEFTWFGGDVHIYENHVDQVVQQLSREVKDFPTIRFARNVGSIDDFKYEDFIVENYEHHSPLKGDVSAQGKPGKSIKL